MRPPRWFTRQLKRIDRNFYLKYYDGNFHLWLKNQPIPVMSNLDGLTSQILEHIRKINFISTDSVGWLKKMRADHADLRARDEEYFDDQIHQLYKYYRRWFARYAWGTEGKLWEFGSDIPKARA